MRNEVGGSFDMEREMVNVHRNILRNLNQGGHLENLSTDGRMLLKRILKKHDVAVDWFQLAHIKTR
jgi:hypothetical protein